MAYIFCTKYQPTVLDSLDFDEVIKENIMLNEANFEKLPQGKFPEISPALNMSKEEYRNHISTTVNHFYEKLFLLKDMMNTDSAREIAEYRERYMKEYINEFMDEWEGRK